MEVRDIVEQLCKKYKTRNPYELVNEMGIILQYGEGMDNVRGFYLYANRIKLICIGNNMPEYMEKFVVAHELGHAVMHKHSSAPFCRRLFSQLINWRWRPTNLRPNWLFLMKFFSSTGIIL